ncbi:MAG: hypothetical protein R3B13_01185 [Polyangiaceae bacterium]
MDALVLSSLVGSFAVLVTTHVAISYGLLRREPWWRGPIAFVFAPVAPLWAMESGMKRRAALWIIALCVYVLARIFAEL